MSQLESKVKPFLSELVDGNRNVSTLSDVDCRTLGRWALKTAIVLTHAAPLQKPIDKKHLSYLKDHPDDGPGRVGVFGGHTTELRRFGYLQTTQGEDLLVGSPRQGSPAPGSKVALCFKQVILVVAVPVEGIDYRFELAEGLHIPVWPSMKRYPAPPAPDLNDILKLHVDALGILYAVG